ncbi:SOS response-associated peptidase [Chromobacterium phragmitis]|uniref:Abasic site processing protein n=1 Tax=Chromobacterium phragmitis TaxID=2202141 RepID=A0ABV0IPY9_9NEIS
MCVNFLPPSRAQLREWFGCDPGEWQWQEEAWQDYLAPILTRDGLRLASYGFVPKRHQPAGVRLSTMNARAETIGQLRSYRDAWRHGQLCLVPMQAFYEPCYDSGRAVRTKISMADGAPFAAAGLWREWREADGSVNLAFTQITINADGHAVMGRMHLPGDEKRSLAIIPAGRYRQWLSCSDPEQARAFLQPFEAEDMRAEGEIPDAPLQGSLFD